MSAASRRVVSSAIGSSARDASAARRRSLKRAMNPVSSRPATNSGSRITSRKKGSVVLMPPTAYSESARRMRSIASARVRPHVASFEMRGS